MFNIIGILLALVISSSARGSGVLVGWESLVAAGAGVLAVLFFYYSVSSHVVDRWELIQLRQRALDEDSPPELRRALQAERDLMMRRIPAFRVGVDTLILALYAVQVWVFGWCDFVSDVLGVPMFLDVLPNLAPYFLMLGASWVGQYRIEQHVRSGGWKPLRFIAFQSRANIMTILPLLLIYAIYWVVLEFVPQARELSESFEFLGVAGMLLLMIVISAFVPVVIRLILPGGPMPDGRLRRRLETFARDRGLKVNNIFVWRTGTNFFATAFVIGLFSPFRYVFFTDTLLKRMSEDEALAVFAHEMGHVHHRHLWWLLAFILSFTLVLIGVSKTLEMAPVNVEYAQYIALGGLLFYAYATFGYISRRFERQADAYAADHTSIEHISSVLLRLGRDNPVALKKHGWRHFSLERRVHELILHKTRPEVKRVFRVELAKGLAIAIGVTLLASALLVVHVRNDVVSGLATYSLAQFHEARDADADPARIETLRERTIDRSRAMADIDPEYEASAYWYEAQVQVLTGKETDAFERLAKLSREQAAKAPTEALRKRWEVRETLAEAGRVAAHRALTNNTSFEHELDVELQRHGLR